MMNLRTLCRWNTPDIDALIGNTYIISKYKLILIQYRIKNFQDCLEDYTITLILW